MLMPGPIHRDLTELVMEVTQGIRMSEKPPGNSNGNKSEIHWPKGNPLAHLLALWVCFPAAVPLIVSQTKAEETGSQVWWSSGSANRRTSSEEQTTWRQQFQPHPSLTSTLLWLLRHTCVHPKMVSKKHF